jgi:hypothetical protein
VVEYETLEEPRSIIREWNLADMYKHHLQYKPVSGCLSYTRLITK